MTFLAPRNAKSLIPSVFSDFFDNDEIITGKWMNLFAEATIPAVNIKENDTKFLIEMAAPGFEKKDFHITIDHDVLSISAGKEEEKKDDKASYRRREYSYSSFSRSFHLPKSVTSENIEAVYDKGVLHLSVPKVANANASSAREITVA